MKNISLRLKNNNFDLLRLLFAATVCLVHTYELSGFKKLSWIKDIFSSSVAVKAFFIVSGFLIFMSFERSTDLLSYASKRIRRIYPAYFTVIMICAVGLVTVSSKGTGDYFSSHWIKYIAGNLFFLNFFQPTLPGVFDYNKLSAVNGALWTLKIEALFYLTVPVLVFLFRKFSRLPVLLLVYCASIAYVALMTATAQRTGSGIYTELARQLPGQLSYFMAGAFFYYYLPLFERHVVIFLTASILIIISNSIYPIPLMEPLALSIIVIFFSLFLYAGNFGKYGDYSYGFYILHFPVIQLLLMTDWAEESPWYFLTTVIFITSIGAIVLWHLVEKRFLYRNSHYLETTSSPATGSPSTALQT